MVSKNSEARKCANTNRASIENNREGNIDMNSVQNKELSFHNVTLVPAPVSDGIWLTSTDIAKALGYASPKSVTNIYSRNSDEFTSSMSMVIKMMTNGINNNLREKSVRVFSLRGCHLIAMFATTDKAKEFRRWVLDVLDREVANSPIAKQFTDDELSSLAWLWRASDIMLTACESVTPLLKVAEHRQAGHFHTIGQELPRTINKARRSLSARQRISNFTHGRMITGAGYCLTCVGKCCNDAQRKADSYELPAIHKSVIRVQPMTSINLASKGSVVTDKTIDSQSLLMMVNQARTQCGEPEVRNNKFIEKVVDELEGSFTQKV